MLINILLVSCGGFFGSVARFWLANQWKGRVVGTWIANVTGSLLLAIVFRLYVNDIIGEYIWLLFGVGYCGAYTTFSTFGKETVEFFIQKQYRYAIQYVLSSFLLSFIIVVLILVW